MKKLVPGSLFMVLGCGFAFSQCNPSIPGNAIVIGSTQTTGFGGSSLWVCSGDTLTSNGGTNTIYLEIGAYLYAGGGSNTIYVPAGAKINLSSGSNIIYYVNLSDLISPGGGPTLTQCPSITYNYSSAPPGGCAQTTAISFEENKEATIIFPNPTDGKFTIYNLGLRIYSVEITDALGKEVFNSYDAGQKIGIDWSLQPKGIYFVKVSDEKGNMTVKKLLLQ